MGAKYITVYGRGSRLIAKLHKFKKWHMGAVAFKIIILINLKTVMRIMKILFLTKCT